MPNKFQRFFNAAVGFNIANAATVFKFQNSILSSNRSYSPSNDTISTLVTCQKILADSISKMPLEVYLTTDRKGKQKLKDHRLYRTLHTKVNSWQTSNTFWNAIEFTRDDKGNSYALINRDSKGKVTLQFYHPDNIKGAGFKGGELYYITIDGNEIHNAEILHFRGLVTDKYGVFGMNPVQALYYNLDNVFQGQTTLNASYKNALNTERLLKSKITTTNKDELKNILNTLNTGATNTGKIQLIPYDAEIITLPKPTIQDAQILDSLKFQKLEIASLFGVPAWMLNINEGLNYNNIEQSFIAFKVNTIQPIARMYRQELESKLLWDGEIDNDISIEFNLNSLVEADMTTRANFLDKSVKAGYMKLSTAAKIEGLEIDESIDANFIQSQYQPLQSVYKNGEWKPVTNGSTNNLNSNNNDDEQ